MNFKTRTKLILVSTLMFSLSSCYELQSDEELRQDIIGTWHKTECSFPNNSNNPNGFTDSNPLSVEMTFLSDGRFSERNTGPFGYCTLDTALGGITTCTWDINDGNLIIVPDDQSSIPDHILQQFPIKCLKGNQLVFDNTEISFQGGLEKLRKACYERN